MLTAHIAAGYSALTDAVKSRAMKFNVNVTVVTEVPFCDPAITVVVDAEDETLAKLCVMTLMAINVSHEISSVEPAGENEL